MEPCEECGATEGVRAFGIDQTPLCPTCYARAERNDAGAVRALEIAKEGMVGDRVVALAETGRVPKLRRIEDAASGFTKFTLEHTEGEPPTVLLWAGPGEQADHAWFALELVALAFAPGGEVSTWRAEREIVDG